ncbi:uncharacterized protein N7458_000214 [Penicillium daleae]|uniref:Uncharacterized protein n=1 Tax=Penicillium daleae TaxID=63821 RepID=A0AAD6CG61_9EURO|nr:uncharacterized protein N7458_000214 [Penicillium daleae]KAJ5464528.1 hypothetical protein N7458_000214 [Penicillium daleae]
MMEFPEPRRPRILNCEALIDQTDLIGYQCTATDVASVWTSILAYWFPPDEGYQLRLKGLLKDQIREYLDHVKAEFGRTWGEPYIRYLDNDIQSYSLKDGMSATGDISMEIETNDGDDSLSHVCAEPRVESDDTGSMETSSAGSSDLDTDSDIIRTNENERHEWMMKHHEGSQNTTADPNNQNPIENGQLPYTNGFRITIEFTTNGMV